MKKNIIARISAVFLALIVGFGAPAVALAGDTGGGLGGGGGSGSLTGPIYWKSIAYNDSNATNQKTWKKFLSEANWDNNTIESQVRLRVGNLEVCKKSKVIWYINHNRQNKWVFNFRYAPTHGTTWDEYHNNVGKSTIENPRVKIGRVPTTSEVEAFKNWDKKDNGNKINAKPGYTIICSGAFLEPPDEYFDKLETNDSQDVKNSAVYNRPYSYITDVKPQFSGGTKKLVPQAGKPVKTNYGKLWDQINSGKLKLKPADLDKRVKAALEKDKGITHSQVSLNNNNKEAMAQGGVLNVYEQTTYAKVSSQEVIDKTKVQKCTYVRKWNSKTGQFNSPVKVRCVPVSNTAKSTVTMDTDTPTAKNTGFYQMLSVHCNPEQFNALIKSGNGIVKTSGSAELVDGKISGSALTKNYTQQPTVLDFGDKRNPNAARAVTGTIGFYDKECGFECTADKTTANAKKNGANSNVETGGKVVNGNLKGVTTTNTSGTVNSNSVELFRDNDKSTLKTDLWYPVTNGAVRYNGEEPITTTVSRWEEGTPHPQSTKGGKFTMTTADGTQLFTGSDNAKTQKNWNQELFSNANSTILKDAHTEFNVSSTWASEQGKPQVINVKYEYDPQVNSRIYANNLSFNNSGARVVGTPVNVSTAIEGKCYVNYKNNATDKQMDTKKLFSDNTGTGTKNNLDGKIVQGAGSVEEAKSKQTNLVINFVRSTTE